MSYQKHANPQQPINPDGSIADIRSWMKKPKEERRKKNNEYYFPTWIKDVSIPDGDHYKIVSNKEQDFPKFGLKRHITRFSFKIPENKDRENAEDLFKQILQKLIDNAYDKRNVRPGWNIEKFHMELHAEVFSDPVVIPVATKEKNNPDSIYNAFMKLQQSYKDVNILHQPISAYITTISLPVNNDK